MTQGILVEIALAGNWLTRANNGQRFVYADDGNVDPQAPSKTVVRIIHYTQQTDSGMPDTSAHLQVEQVAVLVHEFTYDAYGRVSDIRCVKPIVR